MPHAPSFERILVTGATGFIGRHLLKCLVAGNHRPVAIARKLSNANGILDEYRETVRWMELDLLDHNAVRELIETERPSVIFHLAGTKGGRENEQEPALACKELNVDATRHLLEVATRAGVERVVILGSAEEYGNQSGPFDESRSLDPISEYGKSKAEATRLALDLHRTINCPVVVLRLFTVYGPHQPSGMFVSDAIKSAVGNVSFSMSEGTQERDLVYVDDVTSALMAAANTSGVDGKVFNLGSGRPIQLLVVANLIWFISKSSAALKIGARERASDDMQVTWADASLARQYLGWTATVDLETGLRATIDWAREHA